MGQLARIAVAIDRALASKRAATFGTRRRFFPFAGDEDAVGGSGGPDGSDGPDVLVRAAVILGRLACASSPSWSPRWWSPRARTAASATSRRARVLSASMVAAMPSVGSGGSRASASDAGSAAKADGSVDACAASSSRRRAAAACA